MLRAKGNYSPLRVYVYFRALKGMEDGSVSAQARLHAHLIRWVIGGVALQLQGIADEADCARHVERRPVTHDDLDRAVEAGPEDPAPHVLPSTCAENALTPLLWKADIMILVCRRLGVYSLDGQ